MHLENILNQSRESLRLDVGIDMPKLKMSYGRVIDCVRNQLSSASTTVCSNNRRLIFMPRNSDISDGNPL